MLTDLGNAKSSNPQAGRAATDFKDKRRRLHSGMMPSGWNTNQCWQPTAK